MDKQKTSTKHLLAYRFLAYTTDFVILMIIVMGVQFGFSSLTGGAVNSGLTTSWTIYAWVLGTVTLPVYVYFILSEYSKRHATIGKYLFGLKVTSDQGEVSLWQSFIRNFVKVIIPWEVTHIALLFPTPILANPTSNEFRITLFVPYIIFAVYGIYLFVSRGKKTLHDAFAKTNVQFTKQIIR